MKKINIIIVLIFILTFALRAGLLFQKDGLFYDEVLNMTAANHNELYFNKANYFQTDKTYYGSDVKKMFLLDNSSLKDAISDIRALHKNSGDILHTNFYYSLVRISLIGLDNYNLNDYLIRIGCLNLILFSLSFFIMYKLLNMIFEDKKYLAVGLFLAFFNPISMYNTIFLREYQLQELFVILITYLALLYYKNPLRPKDIPLVSLTMAFSLLSGYYISIITGYFFIMLLFKKDFKNFFIIAICTLCILLILYPSYFNVFIERFFHNNVLTSVSKTAPENTGSTFFLITYLKYIVSVYRFICSYILTLFFIWLAFKTPKNSNKKLIYLITALSWIWIIIVMSTAPYKISRYINPIIPICTIILSWLLCCNKTKKALIITACFLTIHVGIVTANTFSNNDSLKFRIKLEENQKLIIEEKKQLPIYIISKNYETLARLINNINDNQKVTFINSINNIKDKNYYLCTDENNIKTYLDEILYTKKQDTNMFYNCYEFSE